jgi:penicillin-binding protein 1A
MRVLTVLFSAFALLAIVGLVVLIVGFKTLTKDLPDYSALKEYEPKVATRVHAGDGRLLAEFATERRIFVPIDAIPQRLVNAFLSAEDKNFYEHDGVDIGGNVRAMLTNLKNAGANRRPIGASTITQQVARIFFLSNEVSYVRKAKEAVLAYRIESALSKPRILEIYLNEINLGFQSYGVAAASQAYFGKSLDELSLSESAFLAALPKAPHNYNPLRHYEAAVARRNYVLDRMLEDGVITDAEAKEAKSQAITVRQRDADTVVAGHFTEEVRRQLIARYGGNGLYGGGLSVRTTLDPKLQQIAVTALRRGLVEYDERHGYRGPLQQFKTMNDWAKQLAAIPVPEGADTWRAAAVLEVGKDHAKIGFADGKTAELRLADVKWARPVLASGGLGAFPKEVDQVVKVADAIYVENLPVDEKPAPAAKPKKGEAPKEEAPVAMRWKLRQVPAVNGAFVAMDPESGRVLAMVGGFSYATSEFNRATQAMRQPGSSFKPFVYLTALDNGFTPSTIVLDEPVEYDQGPGLPRWAPENYGGGFYGPMPLRVALEKSRNVCTVRVAAAIGMPKIVDTARKFGIVDNMPAVLSMALGAGETTLMRMVTAYSMLANGGKRIQPTVIDRVQDRYGKTLYRHDQRACEYCTNVGWGKQATPLPPDDREQIDDPRTVYQLTQMLEGVVQRGTAAIVGQLKRPLAGKTGTTNESKDVWFVGFSPNLAAGVFIGYDDPKPMGDRETGGGVSAPVFKEFTAKALADEPPTPFRIPPGLKLVRIDPSTGNQTGLGDPRAIWQAYLPGTEPGRGDDQMVGNDMSKATPAATTGTGGLY